MAAFYIVVIQIIFYHYTKDIKFVSLTSTMVSKEEKRTKLIAILVVLLFLGTAVIVAVSSLYS